MNNKPAIHIIYEYGADARPLNSACLRLLRPFSHPGVTMHLQTSFGGELPAGQFDVVIVDSLWRPDITVDKLEALIREVRNRGAKLVYCLDESTISRAQAHQVDMLAMLLRSVDTTLVPTLSLQQHLAMLAPGAKVQVVPNQLDERLLVGSTWHYPPVYHPADRVVVGMLAQTGQLDDFRLILPALGAAARRWPGKLVFQIAGAWPELAALARETGLPVRFLHPKPGAEEYPLFLPWFSATAQWDIALAPIAETPQSHWRSDLEFLNYAAIAAAGIYSHVPAYADSVVDGQTGLLVENTAGAWEAALEQLIDSPELRQQLGMGAMRALHTRRTLAHRSSDYVSLVKSWIS